MPILEFNQVSLWQEKRAILQDLSFSLPSGEICCLLGRNGAGKSSLFKSIFGIYQPQEGTIQLNGLESNRQNRNQFLTQVGGLIEGAALYEHLTAYENLDFVRRYYAGEVARIKEVLDLVGLREEQDKKSRYFSSGMKQRLGLAMALFHRPALVILDEPTNALDPEGISEFRGLVKRLNKTEGVSFLISTHQLEEAGYYNGRVLILKEGKLVFDSFFQPIDFIKILSHTLYPQLAEELKGQSFFKDDESFSLLHTPLEAYPFLWDELPSPSLEDIYLALHQQQNYAKQALPTY